MKPAPATSRRDSRSRSSCDRCRSRCFSGRVARIGIESDRVNEERRVYVTCANCPEAFYLGEQAEVFITTAVLARALMVPEAEHRRSSTGRAGSSGRSRTGGCNRRRVTLGKRTLDGRIEIRGGLPEGALLPTAVSPDFREGRARARRTGRRSMNLAIRDIRHNLGRFLLTCVGLSLLLGVVMSMIGIYRGLVAEALTVVRSPAVDLWVVEADTRGPFAEASRIPGDAREAVARIAGVLEAGSVNFPVGRNRARRAQAAPLSDRLRARPARAVPPAWSRADRSRAAASSWSPTAAPGCMSAIACGSAARPSRWSG